MRRQPKIDMDAVSSVDPVMAMRMRNATTKKTMRMAKEAHVLTTNRNVDDISLNTLTYLPGAKKKVWCDTSMHHAFCCFSFVRSLVRHYYFNCYK